MAAATQRVSARIPGKDDEHGAGGKYAFVEFEASNVAEFEKLIAEARVSPAFRMYDFDGTMGRKIDAKSGSVDYSKTATEVVKEAVKAAQKKTPAKVVEAEGSEAEAEGAAAVPQAEPTASTSTPSDGEKLSPRDIARAKLLARKGA